MRHADLPSGALSFFENIEVAYCFAWRQCQDMAVVQPAPSGRSGDVDNRVGYSANRSCRPNQRLLFPMEHARRCRVIPAPNPQRSGYASSQSLPGSACTTASPQSSTHLAGFQSSSASIEPSRAAARSVARSVGDLVPSAIERRGQDHSAFVLPARQSCRVRLLGIGGGPGPTAYRW